MGIFVRSSRGPAYRPRLPRFRRSAHKEQQQHQHHQQQQQQPANASRATTSRSAATTSTTTTAAASSIEFEFGFYEDVVHFLLLLFLVF